MGAVRSPGAAPPSSAALHRPEVSGVGVGSVVACPVLRAAIERVATGGPSLSADARRPGEVPELLQLVGSALSRYPDLKQVDSRLRCVLGRRLVDLVRREVVREWSAQPGAIDLGTALSRMEAFEALSQAIEPDWDHHFASRLSGPGGLDLVVEVAHDLRSPLTSVLFLAETLQRGQSGPVNDLQHRQLGLIYSAALGLSTLASNVIELAREGTRLTDDEPVAFSATEILESVYDIVQPMAQEKRLSVRLLPPANDHRMGHPQALSRVLLNLTTNAIKFTEEGFVEIVGRAKGPSQVEFSVRDTGNGINPQTIETLYSAFRRAPTGDRYAFSGTGLGLALCRKLVQVMGSDLKVETRPKWGTRFYFDLELPAV